MKVSKELIQHIMDRGKSTAQELSMALLAYEQIRKDRTNLDQKKLKLKQDCDMAIQQLDAQITHLRKACDHPETRFHGDPSGGSDKWTECLLCGAEVK